MGVYILTLPSYKKTARQINSKATLTIFYYVSTPSFKRFHTKAVKGAIQFYFSGRIAM